MKISEKWLREWVNPALSTGELVACLTMAGLEVESVTPVAGDFSGVVVGEIVSIAQHPDADKLSVCQVAGHPDGILQVVCGAANARQGIKIPFALVGAVLPPKAGETASFNIKAAKLRGVDSNGMLCAASELGMESALDGLLELPADAPVGKDIRAYLELNDQVIEFGLTPNRGDCLSVAGMAREIAALTLSPVTRQPIVPVKAVIADTIPVTLEAAAQCPRYAGRIIRNIDRSRSSPLWLQEKLRRSGIRAINPVVDVTNYVLLELGQPMHAFDFNKLQGEVKVRLSVPEEAISLLDGQQIKLKKGSLLISDSRAPLALAGIMGGSESSVTGETTDIFLESAYFDPLALAGKARSYGLHTDSSHRFERGVDFSLQEQAIERATTLLLDIVGGQPGPLIMRQSAAHMPVLADIALRTQRVEQYLGLRIPSSDLVALLARLGVQHIDSKKDIHVFRPPAWRFDVRLEVDLLEEIARIYGYNNLPTHSFHANLELVPTPEGQVTLDAMKSRLVALGYREVITYSFVDPALQAKLQPETAVGIPVQNPISEEMGVMRNSLLPGLIGTAVHNINRQQSRVRIFESGLVFSRQDGVTRQEPALGLLICGTRHPEGWFTKASQLVDFYDIKGDIEALLAMAGAAGDVHFKAGGHVALHPGQSATVYRNNTVIGWLGALHPGIQKQLGLNEAVFVAQMTLDSLKQAVVPAFSEVSRFPEVRRDLAFLVDRDVPVQSLCEKAKLAAESYLINLKVFDVYSGEGIDPQRKSVALGLTFQAKSRTLTDSEINENVERVVNALRVHFQAELRS